MQNKPNIIFILADDQGAWAMHCAGNDDIKTPNLDLLAKNGIRFENFFCASPVCSPARASILTGEIPSQHGVHDWIRGGNVDRQNLSAELQSSAVFAKEDKAIRYLEGKTTYVDLLRQNGYNCALSGKWHLGDSTTPQHGFQNWYSIARGGCSYMKPDIAANGEVYFEECYVTDLITDKAISYIDELSMEDAPYYISVHYTAPHDPWDADEHPAEFIDMYRDCEFNSTPDLAIHPDQIPSAPTGTGEERKRLLRGYYAAITAMDAGIGRIITRLQETNQLENTMIIFTADNGMNMGHHGIWGKGNGTFPFNLYDTSVKVPFIISYKGSIKEGFVSESLCSHYDIIHTFNEFLSLGGKLHDKLPGVSFANILGTAQEFDNHIIILDEYGNSRMIRDKEWKYINRLPYGKEELYHIAADKDETTNLVDMAEYEHIKTTLRDNLTKWYAKYSDPNVAGISESVYGFGQLCKAGIYSNGKQAFDTIPKTK